MVEKFWNIEREFLRAEKDRLEQEIKLLKEELDFIRKRSNLDRHTIMGMNPKLIHCYRCGFWFDKSKMYEYYRHDGLCRMCRDKEIK